MGEAARTSEARMRAAAQAMVSALDEHGDKLTRVEAITALGTVLGVYAMAWGGEAEVVNGAASVAKALIEGQRAHAAAEDALLFDLRCAIGDEAPSAALVDEWAARHPGHATAIRERAGDIAAMQARMAETDAEETAQT